MLTAYLDPAHSSSGVGQVWGPARGGAVDGSTAIRDALRKKASKWRNVNLLGIPLLVLRSTGVIPNLIGMNMMTSMSAAPCSRSLMERITLENSTNPCVVWPGDYLPSCRSGKRKAVESAAVQKRDRRNSGLSSLPVQPSRTWRVARYRILKKHRPAATAGGARKRVISDGGLADTAQVAVAGQHLLGLFAVDSGIRTVGDRGSDRITVPARSTTLTTPSRRGL